MLTVNARLSQLMAAGGNLRGRQFFKQHGWDDVGSDKIEAKVWLNRSSECLGAVANTRVSSRGHWRAGRVRVKRGREAPGRVSDRMGVVAS